MEPLDPKAELMRLANAYCTAGVKSVAQIATGDEAAARRDLEDANYALRTAITLALAAERRRALTDAAQACKRRQIKNEDRGNVASANTAECCHDDILDLVDGKAGGT